MKRFMLLLLATTVLFGGCVSRVDSLTSQGYRELAGEELRTLVSGKQVDAGRWKDVYTADGRMSGISPGGSYTGTWQIRPDGRLCIDSANQYINGCTRVFLQETSGSIVWIEADYSDYSVTITPAI
jgi:hypothetical protein